MQQPSLCFAGFLLMHLREEDVRMSDSLRALAPDTKPALFRSQDPLFLLFCLLGVFSNRQSCALMLAFGCDLCWAMSPVTAKALTQYGLQRAPWIKP